MNKSPHHILSTKYVCNYTILNYLIVSGNVQEIIVFRDTKQNEEEYLLNSVTFNDTNSTLHN